ncbi:hypothetical protein ACHAWF_003717 [Thalassiosira exigua]
MKHIDEILEFIKKCPDIEGPNNMVLGGCLTQKALLWQESSLHMTMVNNKRAVYTRSRDAWACTRVALGLKDSRVIHKAFERITAENHPDGRRNEVAYTWLAVTTPDDPSLGSFEDSKFQDALSAGSNRANGPSPVGTPNNNKRSCLKCGAKTSGNGKGLNTYCPKNARSKIGNTTNSFAKS